MVQKAIVQFWWESGLSSASRKHLTTFCRPFVHYACLRLLSAIVHFIRNSCLYFVCYGWSAHALTALSTLLISVAWWKCCTSSKTPVVDTEAFRHLIMSQKGKRTTKNLLGFHTYKKSRVFLRTSCTLSIVHFSKIRSCKPGCASDSPAAHFLYSATSIRLDQLCPARGPHTAQSKVLCGPV